MKKILLTILISLGVLILINAVLYKRVLEFHYTGDGKFVDRGIASAMNRYILTLGTIDFCSYGKYTFDIGTLPRELYSLDFIMENLPIENDEEYIEVLNIIGSSIVLSIEVKSDDQYIKEEGFLGFQNEKYNSLEMGTSVNDEATQEKRIRKSLMFDSIGYDITPDEIDFFSFFAYNHPQKQITIEVLQPASYQDKNITCSVSLRLAGGGWK